MIKRYSIISIPRASLFLVSLLALASANIHAQSYGVAGLAQAQEDPEQTESINELGGPDGPVEKNRINSSSALTGVLVDRTMTVVGQRFYRAFSQISMERPIIRGATLTIHERPDALWGIQLWITEGTQVYFRTRLSPRLNEADKVARQAVDIVERAIIKRRFSISIKKSPDLGSEELKIGG